MMARDIVNLHCGACGQPFDDSGALMAHIDVCDEAQGTDIMALDRMRRAKDKLSARILAGDYTPGDIDRWLDDGGKRG